MVDFTSVFEYDEELASCLKWKVNIYHGNGNILKNVSIGDMAGTLSPDGYYRVQVSKKKYSVHRIIYEMFNGKIPDKMEIDHIDGNRSNNSINNLRVVCRHMNMRNKKMYTNNTSGITGVYFHSDKNTYRTYWLAMWCDLVSGKLKHKYFSITKLGNEQAFKLACEYRAKAINELNENGAEYTNTHGERL